MLAERRHDTFWIGHGGIPDLGAQLGFVWIIVPKCGANQRRGDVAAADAIDRVASETVALGTVDGDATALDIGGGWRVGLVIANFAAGCRALGAGTDRNDQGTGEHGRRADSDKDAGSF